LHQGFSRTLVIGSFAAGTLINPAVAQVLIPYGDFGDGFEKYLVAGIAFVLLCVAVWRFIKNRDG